MPKRIQKQRTKGWKMPEGAIYVGARRSGGTPLRLGNASSALDRRISLGSVANGITKAVAHPPAVVTICALRMVTSSRPTSAKPSGMNSWSCSGSRSTRRPPE